MINEWIPTCIGAVLACGGYLAMRGARVREDDSLSRLRSATDTYRDARHEREEAHRVLRLTCELRGIDPDALDEEAEESESVSPEVK